MLSNWKQTRKEKHSNLRLFKWIRHTKDLKGLYIVLNGSFLFYLFTFGFTGMLYCMFIRQYLITNEVKMYIGKCYQNNSFISNILVWLGNVTRSPRASKSQTFLYYATTKYVIADVAKKQIGINCIFGDFVQEIILANWSRYYWGFLLV
jgi:hypothetical protein